MLSQVGEDAQKEAELEVPAQQLSATTAAAARPEHLNPEYNNTKLHVLEPEETQPKAIDRSHDSPPARARAQNYRTVQAATALRTQRQVAVQASRRLNLCC